MRRFLYALIVSSLLVSLAATDGYCLRRRSLYERFRRSPEVKVYVAAINNLSGSNRVNTEGLEDELKYALDNRKSINFRVVKKREDSDIIINCEVADFYWLSEDPIDFIMGTYGIVYDVLTSENYAYQEAVFTVTDTKRSRRLWKKVMKIDFTRSDMTEEQSIPLINKKTVKIFIRDCFSR